MLKSNTYKDKEAEAVRLNKLSNEELCLEIKKGNTTATEVLYTKNKKLLYKIANGIIKKFPYTGIELADIVQNEFFGMLSAIEGFEDSKDTKFTTYAYTWIWKYGIDAIESAGYKLKIPRTKMFNAMKFSAFVAENEYKNADDLVDKINAAKLFGKNVTLEDVIQYKELTLLCTSGSLSDVVYEDGTQLEQLIEDKCKPFSSEFEDTELVKKAMAVLNDKETKIIVQRYGLDGGEPKTLADIGDMMGLTRERVRQLESKALRKMKVELA